MERQFAHRDAEIVKQKFNRIANENKNTRDQNCPPVIRREKRIARAILCGVQATSLGGSLSSDYESDSIIDITRGAGFSGSGENGCGFPGGGGSAGNNYERPHLDARLERCAPVLAAFG